MVRKWKIKRIIIDFYELHIFGAPFFFNIDELLAFIYFQSVIIVPKVRSDRNYCYIEGNGCPSNMVAKCFSKNCSLSQRLKNSEIIQVNLGTAAFS